MITHLLLGKSHKAELLDLKLANRHGLIAGATGTGKTITMQVMMEQLSAAGVPVFAADAKGDLSGVAKRGEVKAAFLERASEMGYLWRPDTFPVTLWDVYGEQGIHLRTTVNRIGPQIMSRMLGLSPTQEGVLNIAFKISKDNKVPITTLQELRITLLLMLDNARNIELEYGTVAKSTVATIIRQMIALENAGADKFFGQPAVDIMDMLTTDSRGYGQINVLAADKLIHSPKLYGMFMLWLMNELFENLPEVGNPAKPVMVFFFDEAHVLFNDAPKIVVDAVEKVVRLIRSKGVGIYFVTQSPMDIPERVLGQLGNRVQHALRAYTPKDQKAVRAAAETFRPNPKLDVHGTLLTLKVGEALVSMLDAHGVPSVVERTKISPPSGGTVPLTKTERADIVASSPLGEIYVDEPVSGRSDLPVPGSKYTRWQIIRAYLLGAMWLFVLAYWLGLTGIE